MGRILFAVVQPLVVGFRPSALTWRELLNAQFLVYKDVVLFASYFFFSFSKPIPAGLKNGRHITGRNRDTHTESPCLYFVYWEVRSCTVRQIIEILRETIRQAKENICDCWKSPITNVPLVGGLLVSKMLVPTDTKEEETWENVCCGVVIFSVC